MNKLKVLIASVVLFSNFAMATVVRVQSHAEISKAGLTLGDIAIISSDSDSLRKKIEHLNLGDSPAAGRNFVWTASDVSQKLHVFVDELSGVQIKIPDSITIERVSRNITATGVKEKIVEALRVTLPDPTWEFEVSDVQLPTNINSIQTTDFQIVPQIQRPKGASTFELLAQQENKTSRFWVTARVKYFCNVALIERQIEPHSKIIESDIKWQRREVTFINDIPATQNELATGVSRSTLSVGTVLLRSQLEREMALKFGQQIELIAGDESFSISSKGIAQQNGFIGDVVKVRSEASSKMLDGIVVAKGVVNVRY
jgi:flagella basal body P-ring formation protein FlgA